MVIESVEEARRGTQCGIVSIAETSLRVLREAIAGAGVIFMDVKLATSFSSRRLADSGPLREGKLFRRLAVRIKNTKKIIWQILNAFLDSSDEERKKAVR